MLRALYQNTVDCQIDFIGQAIDLLKACLELIHSDFRLLEKALLSNVRTGLIDTRYDPANIGESS